MLGGREIDKDFKPEDHTPWESHYAQKDVNKPEDGVSFDEGDIPF